MKKYFALAACAILFAGCDFVGGSDGPVASVANITITDAVITSTSSVRVEVQDVAGRAYSSSEHAALAFPLSLGVQFDVYNGPRDLFIVVLRDNGTGTFTQDDLIGSSDSFDGDALAAAAGSSVQVGGGVSATIDVAGAAQ